jgi:curved DNA-binding protein CbpA
MDPGDDAYQVLGVSERATDTDIKKAYRKLALQYHPDRQPQNASGQRATTNNNNHHLFAKISNAYEILSNPQKRRAYDRARRYGRHYQDNDHGDDDDSSDDDEEEGPHHTHTHHTHTHRASSSSRAARHPEDFFADLHDPFEVFERVFQQEFGRMHQNQHNGMGGRNSGNSPFGDPFFRSSPFGNGGSFFGSTMNTNPFMASAQNMTMMNNPFMMGGHPGFGGGGGGGGGGANVMTSMSTSSVGGFGGAGGGGGSSVSTSTTTRIVNGQQETVTERVVRHPDGRVERHVETSGGVNASSRPPPMPGNNDPRSSSRRQQLSGQTRPRSSRSNNNNNNNNSSKEKDAVVDLTSDEANDDKDNKANTSRRASSSTQHNDKKTKRGLKFSS